MSSPVLMSPSVLNADLTRLREEVERIATVSDLIHLDVMDGLSLIHISEPTRPY